MLHPLEIPQNSLNQQSFESNYRIICNHLLDFTRAKNLLKGQLFHAHVIKSGLQIVPLICHHLINFYAKLQLPYHSEHIFDETQFKSTTTWSSIISCFTQNELPLRGLEYFRLMLSNDGMFPDDHIFPCATKACAMVNGYRLGQSVHCVAVKIGFDVNVYVGSSVVDMYAKCGSLVDARKMFDEMPERNVVSWSGMIYGYAQMGEDDDALRLFKDALWEGLAVNDFTFSSVIRVCGNSTLFELGKQMHGLCLKLSYDETSFVGSALISMYSKSGIIDCAYRVFSSVLDKNLGMWNAMLIACAQHAHTRNVFELFMKMEKVGMKPNFITFLCMLYACSHAGLVNEGKHYFHLMKEHKIEPGSQHYASMVDLLGRAGKLQEAMELIEEMPMQPTESVWGALLTGCRIHGNAELAGSVADRVFELGPVSPGLHVLLSNAYAAAGRYQEAAKARKMLKDRGQKKETGLSWVEEGNRIHTFASGDRKHEISEKIYKKLEELEDELERAGYVVDTTYVLQEVGDEEKRRTIRYHSERLAIAFALITFPPGRVIRVMKNLRVCGDCHVAIKAMSKCTGRVIINGYRLGIQAVNVLQNMGNNPLWCLFKDPRGIFKKDELGLEIAQIALPAALALTADPIASLIDTAFIGHIGPIELAAVGVAIAIFNQASKIAIFPLVSVTTSLVAEEDAKGSSMVEYQELENMEKQSASNNEKEELIPKTDIIGGGVNKRHISTASSALIIGGALGLIQAIILICTAKPLLNYMGVNSNSPMLKPALRYLTLRSLSAPAVLLSLAMQAVFRGFKDTKTPLYATVVGDVANIVLDPIFIFLFGMGVSGAAIAHVISQYLISSILMWRLMKQVNLLPPTIQDLQLSRFLKNGFMLLIRVIASTFCITLATSLAAKLGSTSMAAFQICLQVWLVTSLLADGLAVAGQAILANAFARNDYERITAAASRVLQLSLVLGMILSIIVAIILQFSSQLFTNDINVLHLLQLGIPFVAATQSINSLAFVFDGLNYGASDFAYSAYSMASFNISVEYNMLVLAILKSWISWYMVCFIYLYEFKGSCWIFEDRDKNRTMELSSFLIYCHGNASQAIFIWWN
ncbi:hypothetical protein BUALT_Bualt12G0013900 [Buddleja alternifolia]|uniref:Protein DETOXIFICATION n=1 Tax=Buddleja alternifolia TaxID=168488 RepID=A0AAV6WVX6_9LAMI|nr:hypothetical protein BUALT_Bualt12G0013900 [Buddleja alternifolia]